MGIIGGPHSNTNYNTMAVDLCVEINSAQFYNDLRNSEMQLSRGSRLEARSNNFGSFGL